MLTLHLYGLFIGIGIIVGLWVSSKAQKRLSYFHKEYAVPNLEDLLIWLIIPGIIGSRIYHVVDYFQYYSFNPWEIFKIWNGGLGIFGGIGGGLIGLFLYRKYHDSKQSIFYALDLFAFGLPIAQAIGRIGNFFNQELYGVPTNLWWGIWIDEAKRPVNYTSYSRFHPLFAYEAIGNIILLIILIILLKKPMKMGLYFIFYLIGYGILRFCLDFLRIEPWRISVLTTAQWVSLIMVLCACFVMVKKRRI